MLTQADPIVKNIELGVLQTFSFNFMRTCKENGHSIRGACAKAGIAPHRLYEMRDKTFSSRIGIYTLCNLANFVGVPLLELFTPIPGVEYKAKDSIRKKFKV